MPGMKRFASMIAIAAVLASGVVAVAAPSNEEIHRKALAYLHSRDADERMGACAALAEVGSQSDLQALQARLFDDDEKVRATAEAAIWAIWSRSGDPEADRLFRRGVDEMGEGHLQAAIETFSRVVAMRPDFTEAWNKRATVYFLLGEDDASLKDCDEVLKRNPKHFGVLAGYGQIYLRKGDLARSLEYFERALEVNPNMAGVEAAVEAVRELMAKRGRKYI